MSTTGFVRAGRGAGPIERLPAVGGGCVSGSRVDTGHCSLLCSQVALPSCAYQCVVQCVSDLDCLPRVCSPQAVNEFLFSVGNLTYLNLCQLCYELKFGRERYIEYQLLLAS